MRMQCENKIVNHHVCIYEQGGRTATIHRKTVLPTILFGVGGALSGAALRYRKTHIH